MRQSHLLDARIHGVLAKKHVTAEGVQYPLYLNNMEFRAQGMGQKIVLMWPLVLSHTITSSSPFWDIKPADLMTDTYELIVYVEGTIESTGEYCQARTSYLPSEVLWGHRFDRLEEFDTGNGRWEIDFEGFHDVVYTTNIRHSPHELYAMKYDAPTVDTANEDSSTNTRRKTPSPPLSVSLHTIPYDSPPSSDVGTSHDIIDAMTMGPTDASIMPEMTSEEEMEVSLSANEDEGESTDGSASMDIAPQDEVFTEIHSDLGNGNLGNIQEEEEETTHGPIPYIDTDDDKSDDEYLSS